MPVDPATGARLPYPGEPGYDPAMAAPAQGMPPAAPAAGMPPAGMPPEGMPPEGGVPPEIAEIAASAPAPKKPYTVKALETLVKQFNDTMNKLADGQLPEVDVDFTVVEGNKWEQPLPPQLFVPLVAINEALKMLEEGKYADKYGFDPMDMTSDVEVRKATAQLKRMANDKKLAEDLMKPEGGAEEAEEGQAPAPGEFDNDDEMLAEGLA